MKFPDRSLNVLHLYEPTLEFAHGQTTEHPKDGLHLYGPHSKPKKLTNIRIGVVGTNSGIGHFKKWATGIKTFIEVPPPGKTEKQNRLHLINFPGIEAAFNITFSESEISGCSISDKDIDRASRILNHHEAVAKVVQIYTSRVRQYLSNEERAIDLWVLVVPEIIYERCRPLSNRSGLPKETGEFGKKQRQRSNLPLLDSLIDHKAEEIFEDVPDFHRQIKAEFLSIAPTQILRETTLDPDAFQNRAGYPMRKTQDRATVAWNIATGIYYKTQPLPPWKLSGIRPGVCYIGLVYKNLPNDPNDHVCCAAQMFLSEGDGVVFRGANGPWKTSDYEYHLKPAAAKDLIEKVLSTYIESHGKPPSELFIHGQTSFNDQEWAAFVVAREELLTV